MSDEQNQVVPVAAPVAAPVVTPAPAPSAPRSAIQVIEDEIGNFIKQREQAVANVHAIEGAIQAARHMAATLRAEEAKAVAFAKGLLAKGEAEVVKLVGEVKAAL